MLMSPTWLSPGGFSICFGSQARKPSFFHVGTVPAAHGSVRVTRWPWSLLEVLVAMFAQTVFVMSGHPSAPKLPRLELSRPMWMS